MNSNVSNAILIILILLEALKYGLFYYLKILKCKVPFYTYAFLIK